jgi:DNA-directed RNA polymerase specialized sigma24 family protein
MPTLSGERTHRVGCNDLVLAPLIEAEDEIARERALEEVLVRHAHPLMQRILNRARTTMLRDDDVEDLAATVNLRLVRRLQRLAVFGDDAIGSFVDFVATLTYHTIYDFLRRRFPERTRLKNRMRYLLLHDPRLSMWNTPAGAVAGLRKWSGDDVRRPQRAVTRENASPAMLMTGLPSEALEAIFGALGGPILVDDLVALVADLWGVVDRIADRRMTMVDRAPAPDVRIASRQYLEILWEEIRALRPSQRAALLFHVRDADGVSALTTLVVLGVATFDQVAHVLEISDERLTSLWRDLPLDDLAIGAALGITRQQVINLRKAARARLARRMARAEGERS